MSLFKKCNLLLLTLYISGCGFTPLHEYKESSNSTNLSFVSIVTSKNREGAWLQIALEDAFNPNNLSSPKKYLLEPQIHAESLPVIIESNGKIQRYRIKLSSSYVLKDLNTSQPIKKGNLSHLVSYTISNSDYSTFVAPNDAIKKGINELAREYEELLGMYFANLN